MLTLPGLLGRAQRSLIARRGLADGPVQPMPSALTGTLQAAREYSLMRPWSRCLRTIRPPSRDRLGLGRAEAQGAVRPGAVVMVEVLAQDLDQVALAQDDQAVQTLSPQGAQYPLAGGVRTRAPERGSGDSHTSSGEDRIEVGAVLRVAVVDQHFDRDLSCAVNHASVSWLGAVGGRRQARLCDASHRALLPRLLHCPPPYKAPVEGGTSQTPRRSAFNRAIYRLAFSACGSGPYTRHPTGSPRFAPVQCPRPCLRAPGRCRDTRT
jgi:hypothetical protein